MMIKLFTITLSLLFCCNVYALNIDISPKVETEPVFTSGDAADDAAFWYNPNNPNKSVIFGTDKKAGVHAFSLEGKRLQFIPSGRVNNIDIRSGYSFGAKKFSILAGSNGSNNSIIIYLINEEGFIDNLNKNEIITGLKSVYGLCMYKSLISKATYIFVSDIETLSIYQYRVLNFFPLKTQMVRQIKTSTTSEGCVADDESGILYFAQEDKDSGVYYVDAEPNDNEVETLDRTTKYNGNINGDTEGLALFNHPKGKLLIASSQGSSNFTVYNVSESKKFLGSFSINKNKKIDGVSRTDGIEIFYGKINDNFSEGILIVQDDMNMDDFELDGVLLQAKKVNQNFKLTNVDKIIENFLD